jgi:uridine phosphorylase
LFGRELGHGPHAKANLAFVEALEAAGVCATEMEASTLFVLAAVASAAVVPSVQQGFSCVPVQAACVLAIYGEVDSEETGLADQRAITVACAGVCAWAAMDASSTL